MDTMQAMLKNQEARARGNAGKVFDWDKAARILKERKPETADAGLREDMGWTSGSIWKDGKPYMNGYTYLSSSWATPVLVIDGEYIECWVLDTDTDWGSDTKYPESAMKILKDEK